MLGMEHLALLEDLDMRLDLLLVLLSQKLDMLLPLLMHLLLGMELF
jgi:hypothetical protein